ncbi:hypothetical protein FH972_026014 [Carpinus fangiana]|uniref:Glycosyl transferase family 1 domain-containing protein n=1 Tax=Carpinus fangiana TaxID=176857 RepID=A0A5N6L2T0_9ROSI|nr:hypothetical protein FH972_026014 [Carpinus fangiana]
MPLLCAAVKFTTEEVIGAEVGLAQGESRLCQCLCSTAARGLKGKCYHRHHSTTHSAELQHAPPSIRPQRRVAHHHELGIFIPPEIIKCESAHDLGVCLQNSGVTVCDNNSCQPQSIGWQPFPVCCAPPLQDRRVPPAAPPLLNSRSMATPMGFVNFPATPPPTPPTNGQHKDIQDVLQSLESETPFPDSLRGKKVLLATESLGPVNGVSRTTQMLISYLRDNGVQVAVVAPQYKRGITGLFRRERKDGPELRLHGYPLPYNPDLTVAYPFRLDRIYSRTFTPDLIYLASPASVGFQFLIQLRQLPSPPIVLLNFQTDLSSYSEILFRAPIDQYAVWLLRIVQGFLFTHRAVHTIFYPSTNVQKYLERAGAPPKKMVRLGRGVDTELFSPIRRDEAFRRELAPNGEIIIATVARLAPEKGFAYLAKACEKLKARGLKFKMLICGGNRNPAVENEIHRYFWDAGLREDTIFTGFLVGEDLARAYAAADLFLHCSITETFGLVVLESMASGVPVIARDEGGPSGIIPHGKSGYLIPPHDMDAFVACAEQLATNRPMRESMALEARKQALETTWEKINSRVAWRLAEALQERSVAEGKESSAGAGIIPGSAQVAASRMAQVIATAANRPNLIWRPAFLGGGWWRLASSLVSALRMEAAVGLILVFWNIAVVPLLVCGFLHG